MMVDGRGVEGKPQIALEHTVEYCKDRSQIPLDLIYDTSSSWFVGPGLFAVKAHVIFTVFSVATKSKASEYEVVLANVFA